MISNINRRNILTITLWAYFFVNLLRCHADSNCDVSATHDTTCNRHPSPELFAELEELSRIVDISYCVGVTGVHKPFVCASRCTDFETLELVKTWETGQLLSDSCGYIALDHGSKRKKRRIIVAFRGTYSFANTIADLSTIPQEYTPYPGGGAGEQGKTNQKWEDRPRQKSQKAEEMGMSNMDPKRARCDNCSVHLGFMTSWRHTQPEIIPELEDLVKTYPNYRLTLVGHSLGGAVAALASLDLYARGWNPQVTTFGEPRVGNRGLCDYIDRTFSLGPKIKITDSYRRVTHVDDPVPLLPLSEWGYHMHGGEVFISKPGLSPIVEDLVLCHGQADPDCIGGAGSSAYLATKLGAHEISRAQWGWEGLYKKGRQWLDIPTRYRIWQLFFAHRDYFWRLGLCVPTIEHTHFDDGMPVRPEKGYMEELR